MRKKSREMTAEWAMEVFDHAPYATVSMIDADGQPYAVPVSLVRIENAFYFHCALEGKKLDAIAIHPEVCITVVSKCHPCVGPKDNSFTLEFKSATAFGHAIILLDEKEKIAALKAISERFLPDHMSAFDAAIERSLFRTAVVRIDLIAPPTGKRKQYDANGDSMPGNMHGTTSR